MKLFELIDRYAELSVKKEKLMKKLEDSKRGCSYTKIEGDSAYFDHNFESEKQYNSSFQLWKNIEKATSFELMQVDREFSLVEESLNIAVSEIDSVLLYYVIDVIEEKINHMTSYIQIMEKSVEDIRKAGDRAYAEHDFKSEHEYDDMVRSILLQIADKKMQVASYKKIMEILMGKNKRL